MVGAGDAEDVLAAASPLRDLVLDAGQRRHAGTPGEQRLVQRQRRLVRPVSGVALATRDAMEESQPAPRRSSPRPQYQHR